MDAGGGGGCGGWSGRCRGGSGECGEESDTKASEEEHPVQWQVYNLFFRRCLM